MTRSFTTIVFQEQKKASQNGISQYVTHWCIAKPSTSARWQVTVILPPLNSWRRWLSAEEEEEEAELSSSVASALWTALTMLSDCASEATEECEVLPGVCVGSLLPRSMIKQ